jgi:class 3 adenylate cyclase/WD40 repeat protein
MPAQGGGGTGTALIKGRYELLDTLGVGGEARVVKALDHQHGRFVALKMRPTGSDQGREDLLREARVLLGMPPHASLPLVREDFFEDDLYVVAMDWVDGTDLARLLRDQGNPGLGLSAVLAYVADAAEALTFLHTQNPPIIHGDVKPANLILARGGRVKLVDFGLSSALGTGGRRTGTEGFRAPEIERGEPPSRASDVYALAATAHALLTGAPPPGRGRAWTGLSEEQGSRLEAALAAGLAPDPQDRPATPGELVERLRAGWASVLPTGVVTFLMTDIEGSTTLWERQPEAMAESLVRHDELIAAAVEGAGGRFLKSMGAGDSTVSVFEVATHAARAAIDATKALAAEPWPQGAPIRVRVGLHTGEAQLRGGDYFGPSVNLVARVCEQALAGEILLSETTAALVAADLPAGYAQVELGPHSLKGIQHLEDIRALTGPGLATAPTGAECPYRGLLAFEADDRHLFFGREEVVAEALTRVASGRLLAVVGASGSGKSSILRAGLLAAVQAGELDGARTGRVITPGAEPPLTLDDDPGEMLVVDQFEELYTQCRDPEHRSRFIGALLGRRGPVAIGVRADFYGEMSTSPELAAAVAHNQVLLGPMVDDDLRRAIAEPARLSGLRLEPGLIDLVLRDVAGEPGALPLMSHALRETWERRNGRMLTVEAYHASGGVSSAVAQTADAVAEATPEPDRPLLRNVFLRLTELGDDVEDTRRRVHIDELVTQGTSPDAVRLLLERLAAARLVILDDGTAEVAHEVLIRRWPTLRRWLDEDREGIRLHRRLSDAARLWDAAGREPADLYRGTRLDAAVEWSRANGSLLNSTEQDFVTASLEELAATQQQQLRANRRLRRALSVSALLLLAAVALLVFALVSRHRAVQAEASARSRALASEAESQVGRDPQRALLLARAALRAAATPEAELAASEALDANTAQSQLPTFGAQGCLAANYLFLFDGGRTAANNTCDGYVVFGDLVHHRLTDKVRVGSSSSDMVLGPDGHSLIVASGRSVLSVDVPTRKVRRVFTAPWSIDNLAAVESGGFLAVANDDTVEVVDLRTGLRRVVARGDASLNPVNGLMWASPQVLLMVTTGQGPGQGDLKPGLTALDVVKGTRTTTSLSLATPPHLAAVNFLRVSADRRTWIVTGAEIDATNNDQVATTWAIDARTQRLRWTARGPRGAYASPVQSSPDSSLFAVGYSSGAADVLDAATGRLVVRESSSSSIAAGDLAIPPGNQSLVTVSLDGIIRTWAARGSERLRLAAPADPVLEFTPDGRSLVLVGERGEIVDGRTGRVTSRFPGFPAGTVFNTCNSACFAATPGASWLTYLDPTSVTPRIREIDGRTGQFVAAVTVARLDAQGVAPDGRVVAAYVDGDRLRARVLDPRTGAGRELDPGQSNQGCSATTPSFTPDSRRMAIVDACLHVVVWDLPTGHVLRTFALPDHATGPGTLLTPDGRYVLTVQGGAFVRGEISTGRSVQVPGSQAEAEALAISPDGRFYAIGRQDGTVDEYDARSLRLVRHHTLQDAIQRLAFSPDSSDLAVMDNRNLVRVWDTCDACENAARLAELAATQTVRELTAGERATFNVD